MNKLKLFVLTSVFFMKGCAVAPSISNEELQQVWSSKESAESEGEHGVNFEWLQPSNSEEECLVFSSSEINDKTSLIWDGECLNGYASGLGRLFFYEESGKIQSELVKYENQGESPILFYYVDHVKKRLLFTNVQKDLLNSDSEDVGGLQVAVSGRFPLEIDFVEFYRQKNVGTFRKRRTLSKPLVIYSLEKNGVHYVVEETNSFENEVHSAVATVINDEMFGYAHVYFHDGNAVSYDVSDDKQVSLPSQYFKKFQSVVAFHSQVEPSISSSIENSELAIERYKNRICDVKKSPEGIGDQIYFSICEERGDLNELSHAIEQRAAFSQRREESYARRHYADLAQAERDRQASAQGFQQFLQSLGEMGDMLNQAGQQTMDAAQQQRSSSTVYQGMETWQMEERPPLYEYKFNPANHVSGQKFERSTKSASGRITCIYSAGATRVLPFGQVLCPPFHNALQ